ncbi:MAG: heme biosynthesis protein HemY [Gammaproteobacteria bacterium]|nr:heme biosynthesis protein HemY [Gammaproteobacteria bacterium]
MKTLTFALLTLIVAVFVALQAMDDPGYALFALGEWTLETTLLLVFVATLLVFVALYFVIRLLAGLRSVPGGVRRWRLNRRERLAVLSLNRGLIDLAEGRWAAAERHVLKFADKGRAPLLNYLAAARAAQAQGASGRRDRHLKRAYASDRSADIAVGLTQAELQLKQQQFEQALATLRHLHHLVPKHAQVLKALAKLYRQLQDWERLLELLPTLRRHKVVDVETENTMRREAFLALLGNVQNSLDLSNIWARVPKRQKENRELVLAYVQQLINLDDAQLAEPVLKAALRRQRDDALLRLYGLVAGVNPSQQLATAESLLKGFEADATALLTAGRLCLRAGLWGRAREHLEASVKAHPSMEACTELGNLLEHLEEPERALAYYREGLRQAPGAVSPPTLEALDQERQTRRLEARDATTVVSITAGESAV